MRASGPHANRSPLTAGAPLEEAAGAVILIHGRGGSAEDISSQRSVIHAVVPRASRHPKARSIASSAP